MALSTPIAASTTPGSSWRMSSTRRAAALACWSARCEAGLWRVRLSSGEELAARCLVNATGPWVKEVLNERLGQPSSDAVRLVKGSHIVVPRIYEGNDAFLVQNDDRRVVFII